MIDLTPVDVRKKKGDFRRAVRGYDPATVDQFLDLVADRMEELSRQGVSTGDRVATLERMVADYRERERALTEALITAQEVREEVRRQAEKAADLLRREAAAEADEIMRDAALAQEQEREALRQLRARRQQLLRSYRQMLEREMSELDIMDSTLEPEADALRGRTEGPRAGSARAARMREDEPAPAGVDISDLESELETAGEPELEAAELEVADEPEPEMIGASADELEMLQLEESVDAAWDMDDEDEEALAGTAHLESVELLLETDDAVSLDDDGLADSPADEVPAPARDSREAAPDKDVPAAETGPASAGQNEADHGAGRYSHLDGDAPDWLSSLLEEKP